MGKFKTSGSIIVGPYCIVNRSQLATDDISPFADATISLFFI